jgi:hypothetical protein
MLVRLPEFCCFIKLGPWLSRIMVHKLTLFIHLSVSLHASGTAMFLAPRVSNHNDMATPNRSYKPITNHNYLLNFLCFAQQFKIC